MLNWFYIVVYCLIPCMTGRICLYPCILCHLHRFMCLSLSWKFYVFVSVNVVGGRTESGKVRVEKASRQSGNHDQLNSGKKGEADVDAYNGHRSFTYEDKSNWGLSMPVDIASVDKVPTYCL